MSPLIIQDLQDRYLNSEPGVQADMANALDTIINSVFSDPEMIGYELLQNADDANATEIEFVFSGNYLIIRHNGDSFTEQNLAAICRYGNRGDGEAEDKKGKADDIEKIGYKGIGFKSVFKVSHQVWVYSEQGYSFKFDRADWADRKLPWQIMPISIEREDLPDEIQNEIKPDRINFVLSLLPDVLRGAFDRGENTIDFKIHNLFKKAQIILFLRHINNMRIEKDGKIRTINRTSEQHIHTITDGRGDTFRWITKQFRIAIPEETKAKLASLPDAALPPKLKNASYIDLGFAAEYSSRNELIAHPFTKLFAYLPTEKRYENLPFFVNSSFLLNAKRTELLPSNEWNKFILEQVGYYQFEWFRELAQEAHFRLSVTDLIAKYADNTTDYHNKAINIGVKKAQNEVPFIAVVEDSSLKKISETIVDQTGLGAQTGEYAIIKESFSAQEPETLYIADPKLKSIQKIVDAGAHNFDRNKLTSALRAKNKFTVPADNLKLIQFFFQKISGLNGGPEANEWNKVLHETPFLLTDTNTLREPSRLYFPEEKPSLPMEIPMELLHTKVYESGIKEVPALKNWLQGIGVAPTTPLAIIRRGILPMIESGSIPQQYIIPITRFIFQHRNALEENDRPKLSKIPVLVQHQSGIPQLLPAEKCYLSDRYEPILPIEQYLTECIFVSYDYVEKEEDLPSWKRFWKHLKVREEIGFEFDERTFDLNDGAVMEKAKPYWEWLQNIGCLPDFNPNGAKRLLTNLNQKYLEYAGNYDFSVKFWEMLVQRQWAEFKRCSNRAYFQHTNGNSPIPSYFVWMARTKSCFPATDGQCYRTEEVFSGALEPLVKDWQPVAQIELTKNQAEALGVRTSLICDDCIALLQYVAKENKGDRERLTALYQYMFQNEYSLGEDTAVISWMAMDGVFRPAAELAYFDAPQFARKSDSADFIFLELKPEDARRFCKNWGIKVVGIDDFQIKPVDVEESSFLKILKSKLPFLASITSHHYNIDRTKAEIDLGNLLNQFEIKASQSLHVSIELNGKTIFEKNVQAWKQGNVLYHLVEWNTPLVRYELVELLVQILEWPTTKAQTLDLLLQLEQHEMNHWLRENGYGTIIIDEPKYTPTSNPAEEDKPVYVDNPEKKPDPKIIPENEERGPTPPRPPNNESNKSAHTLAQRYLESKGYTLDPTDNKAAPGIIKAYKGEEKKAFIVLSAKAGTLYLGQSNWLRLGWDNFELLVLTDDRPADFIRICSQEKLLELNDNDYTIMVKKNTQNPEVITALTEVLKEEEDYARFYFKVKQRSTIFESIKGFEQQSPEENAVINDQDLLSRLQ